MGGFFPGNLPIPTGSAASPGLPFADAPLNGIFKTSGDGFGIAINGKKYFDLSAAGFDMGYAPPQSFALSVAEGSPYNISGGTSSPVITPSGGHLITNAGKKIYQINNITGTVYLTCDNTGDTNGIGEYVFVHPNGNYIFTHCDGAFVGSPHKINTYSFNAISGVATFSSVRYQEKDNTSLAVISPDGKHFYSGVYYWYDIKAYIYSHAIDAISGIISAGQLVIFDHGITGSFGKSAFSGNSFLYVHTIIEGVSKLAWFVRNASTGALIFGGSLSLAGLTVSKIIASGDGKYLYVTAHESASLRAYSINQLDGSLTALTGSPFALTCNYDILLLNNDTDMVGHNGTSFIPIARDPITGIPSSAGVPLALAGGSQMAVMPDDSFIFTLNNPNLNVLKTAATPTYPLFSLAFDPLGLTGGSFSINGQLLQMGYSVQNKSGLSVLEGTNRKQGVAVLVAGTVTVANTSITANSRILLTSQVDGGTPGFLRVSARVASTSFTITSSSATDTSTVAYEIFEPA